jgi:CheY-like chemotaxis protein
MSTKRALIVEDEKDDQKRIHAVLDSRGIEYDTVDSALAAQSKLRQKDYLFVVLDLDLGTGADEGKFLLDTMLQEQIQKPTIIISHAGLLPETIALKGRYDFVKESIDKKHLHTLLGVFDKTIKAFPVNHASIKQQPNALNTKRSLWPDLIPLLVAFVVIIGVIAAVSQFVSVFMISIVLVAALLAFFALAIFLWKRHDELSESAFVKLIDAVIKSLPLLRKMQRERGRKE